ncbi:glycosyltransferase [Amnibacterium endophyticum]|uniref:4,4'-diaponeurosporenoate glycosyltransferase n=1 Tax=Amnibacterium endophyticum TaxID=2109337 RepID=A0ABW4LAL0_9MICO
MIRAVVVAVPARDEEQRLPAALRSIAAVARAVPVVVVVAPDACTDRTAEVARSHGVLVVPSEAGRVGGARDVAVRAGLAAAGEPAESVWVANTDADCAVPPAWLDVHLRFAAAGVALLRGAVRLDPATSPALARAWRRRNPPVEPHPYVHGANLGVRGDAYLAAGGFPDVAHDEDVALVGAVRALGLPTASTDRAPVVTSGRLDGRTDAGFAGYLRELQQAVGF